jgi:hypothetical protein
MNEEFLKFIENSRIKEILGDRKNFVGSKVEYAHDKNHNIYSISINMRKGKNYLLTLVVGDESVEMALSDEEGNIIEHMLHEKDNLVYG